MMPVAAFSMSTRFPPSTPSRTNCRSSARAREASFAARSTLSFVAVCAAEARRLEDDEDGAMLDAFPRATEADRAVDAAEAGLLEVGVPVGSAEVLADEPARYPALFKAERLAKAPLSAFIADCALSVGVLAGASTSCTDRVELDVTRFVAGASADRRDAAAVGAGSCLAVVSAAERVLPAGLLAGAPWLVAEAVRVAAGLTLSCVRSFASRSTLSSSAFG